MKKLCKSNNRVLAGVCGGIGDYLDIDPTIVRICFLGLGIFFGSGILFYILCACLMPEPTF